MHSTKIFSAFKKYRIKNYVTICQVFQFCNTRHAYMFLVCIKLTNEIIHIVISESTLIQTQLSANLIKYILQELLEDSEAYLMED